MRLRSVKRLAGWTLLGFVALVAVTVVVVELWAKANGKSVSVGVYEAPPNQP